MSRRLLYLAACVPALVYSAASWVERDNSVFNQLDSVVKALSEITGLREEHPVPYGRMSQSQLRKFLGHRIKETLKPAEIYFDELTLKLFGLVPPDFDLKKSTIDLLTEQAAAFYDYHSKKLFLLDVASFASEETTLSHELAHALADQHFNLAKFVDDSNLDDDENLAHTAVVEGQASWLMLAFQMRRQGMNGTPTPEMLAAMEQSGDLTGGQYPVLQASPLYIQQSLLFPYAAGTSYFEAVFRRLGKPAFSTVFTDPPTDTAQILHPDLYFIHKKATTPDLPSVNFRDGDHELTSGPIGEFDHRMLLWQFAGKPKAASLAPHALGGRYRIVEAAKHRPVLEYASEWDSEDRASEYFAAYSEGLRKKWKHFDPSVQSTDRLAGTGDSGYFVTRRKGRFVTSVEGIPEELDWQRLVSALN